MCAAVCVRYKFPKRWRLTRRSDIKRVFARRASVSDRFLIMYIAPNGLGCTRLALSVGRRVGRATVRNRCKRLLREAYRLERLGDTPGHDLVCLPRSARNASLEAYRKSLVALHEKARGRLADGR